MDHSRTFGDLARAYSNTADNNDGLHLLFTDMTWKTPMLAEHRSYCEENKLGFGDPAFHAMWRMLIQAAAARFGTVRALEIGVYKGQVISLWSLVGRDEGVDVAVSAISPLRGNPLPASRLRRKMLALFSRRFREEMQSGNFYDALDYESIIRGIYARFQLDFSKVALHRGYSTDRAILDRLADEKFHIVYVDGDHSFAGARHDFLHYGPKVVPGGWLVADDAGCDLPGTTFWRGHESVSHAARVIPQLGFTNVLNVGHNRIYERTG